VGVEDAVAVSVTAGVFVAVGVMVGGGVPASVITNSGLFVASRLARLILVLLVVVRAKL
jgi:hypothetical protein